MNDYAIIAIIAFVFGIVSSYLNTFFFKIDKDEYSFYKKRGEKPPFDELRNEENNGRGHGMLFFGVPFLFIVIITGFMGYEKKSLINFIAGVVLLITYGVTDTIFDKLYYKIKYKRYPHLNPDAKDNEESDKE